MQAQNLFSKNRIAIFDANGFYAQVETIHRPELRGEPIAILGNTGGIVIAASKEAKELDIDIGVTAWEIKKVAKGNHVYVFSSNFETYAYYSRLLFGELRKHTPFLKIYSIDEGKMDINHIEPEDRFKFGLKVVKDVEQNTRIRGCVGIAPNVSLIKVAVKIAKKNHVYQGVFEINEYNLDWALERTPIEKLWGIGSASARKLKNLGINNAKQFRDYPYVEKIQKLLTINGRKIQLELQGVQCFRIDEPVNKKREISHMRTLGNRTNDLKFLRESLATYATLAAEDMRKEGSLCREIRLFMITDSHSPELPQTFEKAKITFPSHTMDTVKIIRAVWKMLEDIYDPLFEYKKVGVTLSDLEDFEKHQYTLFCDDDDPKRVALMKITDDINKKYKHDTLRSAACGTGNGNFEAERPMMTPSYCTNWNEVLEIKKIIGYK